MKRELYKCDLCKEEYTKQQALKAGMKEYYCTKQYVTSYPDVPSHIYELRDMNGECDTHICGHCSITLITHKCIIIIANYQIYLGIIF